MAAPTTTADLAAVLRKSKLLTDAALDEYLAAHPHLETPAELLAAMRTDGLITRFQAEQLVKGRHKGFVLGKYTLLDRIGMGGMGQVYLAEHAAMRRRVAVKVLPPDRGTSGYARERFLREARAAAALEHPHLVRAFDVDMDGDVPFLVMEYIDGTNLHDLVHRRGPLPPARAAQYTWQVTAGLTAVHERALVHRDIKPANLHLDRAGVVRILDLGLVRSQLDDDALTRGEGARMVGTADYLAPEQAVNSSKVDGRADLYSLGCTLYYLLVGEPPFAGEGKTSRKLIAHQAVEPKPVSAVRPGVPVGLSAVTMKLLAKKPEDRFQSAQELLAALEPWAAGPVLPPEPDDFPAAPVGGAPVTGVSSRVTLGAYSSAGGSALRFTPDPTRWPVASPSNQPTASAQDTLPTRPAVVPAEDPAPVPAPVPSHRRLPAASERDKVAALFGVPAVSKPEPADAGRRWVGVVAAAGLTVLIAAAWWATR